ncbi:hypothetical protein PsorP6_011824 [Peronosclerospora sorghi]|uniref:Uncharacterized protein n=1 Tax=Peronosclerospora sorghi TaxID=230839 RepID=A0ACC0WJY1_9STRA|nr:hypothetical protein PsorP6_011824 [Peronosclerospora sorghi]
MTSLSSGKMGTAVEDYESAPTWLSLLSLEEAYHSALATLAWQNAATTPLLTAIARKFWYCLKLLGALQLHCGCVVQSHTIWKQDIEASWRNTSPKKVLLVTVLFLFNLYVYFPSSHRMYRGGTSCSQLALSLWMLVRAS